MTCVGKMGASAVFVAFGMILPVMFHFVGAIGSIFLPMHIPVLMAGLFLGPVSGLTVGVMTPMLSSLLTGMPPLMPVLPLMPLELAVYGALSGYLYRACAVGRGAYYCIDCGKSGCVSRGLGPGEFAAIKTNFAGIRCMLCEGAPRDCSPIDSDPHFSEKTGEQF